MNSTDNMRDAWKRLSVLLAILISDRQPDPLLISRKMQLPKRQVYEDLMALIRDDNLYLMFQDGTIQEEAEKIHEDGGINQAAAAALFEKLRSGLLDHCSFAMEWFDSTDTVIPASFREYTLLQAYYSNLMEKPGPETAFDIKKNIENMESGITLLTEIIYGAVSGKRKIAFMYRSKTRGQVIRVETFPEAVYHNYDENIVYLIDNKMIPYRLDRICWGRIRIFEEKKTVSLTEEQKAAIDCFWGAPLHPEQQIKETVKVLFSDLLPNTLVRLQAETTGRRFGQLEVSEDGKSAVYTDSVIGMDAFRRWLRSYGSAARLAEPLDAAVRMYESALAVEELYKDQRNHI